MKEDYIMENDYITKYLNEMEVFAKDNNVPNVRKQTLQLRKKVKKKDKK